MNLQTPQIKKSIVVAEGKPGELYIMDNKFKKVIENTKRFNGKFLQYINKRVANGKQFFAYNQQGQLLIEWSLLADRYGTELRVTTYERD